MSGKRILIDDDDPLNLKLVDQKESEEESPLNSAQSDATTALSHGSGNGSVVDEAELEIRVGKDNSLLIDLIEMFLADSPRMLDAIKRATFEQSTQDLQNAAHSLKGTLAIFAASRAFNAAAALEDMGIRRDYSAAGTAFDVLDREVHELRAALRRISERVCA